MKKNMVVIGVVLISLLLVACNKSDADKKDDRINITFGFWGDNEEVEMKISLAEEYMKKNPNVNIEYEYTDGASYLTKMQTWFSSGELPDVYGVASDNMFQFVDSDLIEDLRPYIESDNLKDAWNSEILENVYTYNNKIYAAPFISKVFAIAYNKDLFDSEGIGYPEKGWTVKEMLTYAEKLTNDSPENKIYGIRWGVRPPEFYRNLYGNPVYDINKRKMNAKGNMEFKDAVLLFSESIKKGISPDETSSQISTGGFETGKFGMQLCATWDIATFQQMIGNRFRWDIVELPFNDKFNKNMLSTYRGNGWSINSKSKHKEICWDFIKFMSTNKEAQRKAQKFGIPELKSYAVSDEYLNDYDGGTPYTKEVFINMLNNTTNFVNLGEFAEVNDMMKTQYERLLVDNITIDEMIEEIQIQGEAILNKKE